ncbi:MAG: PQQ-binding-like beta-propeller repeat protein [Verrucomicrobia bacterium]|nr:PQQ-binding-like beta-propeller repeat protein [Verrucomicrobiota bacterium]
MKASDVLRRHPGPRASVIRRIVVGLLACSAACATDWPHYRGPTHDGRSSERILKEWPASGPRVLWKKPLPDGFGSFAVSQGKAYTAVKRRTGGEPQEVFLALNADTGQELWATPVGLAAREGITGEGDGPRSTPTVDGDRVFLLTAYVALYCLNANDGSVVWQRDLLAEFGGQGPDFDAAASPLIEGDLVLVNGPAGGTGAKVFAIHKRDGRTVWEGPSAKLTHSTPVATTFLGVRQVVFSPAAGCFQSSRNRVKNFGVTPSTSAFRRRSRRSLGETSFIIQRPTAQGRGPSEWPSRATRSR